MTRGLGGATIARRTLGAFAPLVAMIALVTLIMALAATALPRAIDGFLTAGVRYDAAQATTLARDLTATGAASFELGPVTGTTPRMSKSAAEAWGYVDQQLADLRAAMPQPMRESVGAASYTATTVPEGTEPEGAPAASLSIGFDPRFLSRVRIVDGVAPAAVERLPGDEPLDVIASRAVADRLEWKVGATRELELADRLRQVVRLSGVFEALDPENSYWVHTAATLTPTVDSRVLPPAITATVFADASSVTALGPPFEVRSAAWYPVDATDLTSSHAATLSAQTRAFTSVSHRLSDTGTTVLSFHSGLPAVLDAALDRGVSSQAVLATVLAGPLGVAIAIEVLIARLAAARLRPSLTLLEARGGSRLQRRLLVASPALVIGIVAAAVGGAVALAIPGGQAGAAGLAAVLAAAVGPAVLLALLAVGSREPGASTTTAARVRLGGELLVAIAAAAALTAALQRGTEPHPGAGPDLLSAATPLLLSLVGCIVALRVYPLALGRVLARAHRSIGFAAFFGTARALRGGTAGLVPVLTVLVGVSVAIFGGVLSATLASGLDTASRSAVGADIAIGDVRLDEAAVDRVRSVDGVAAVASVSTKSGGTLAVDVGYPLTATLVLVDPADLARVQRDVPGALPIEKLLAPGRGARIPLAAPRNVATAVHNATRASLTYVDVTLRYPALASNPFGTGGYWVVADRANADALDFTSPEVADRLLVRLTAGADEAAVLHALTPIVGADATVQTPAKVRFQLDNNPAVGGIRAAVWLSIVGSIVLSSAALILTTVLDARGRRRTLALLSTLGLSRRQARAAVLWELAPLSAVGLVVGAALGAVLSAVVLATVNLRPFTAGVDQPALTVDPLLTASTIAGFVAVVVVTALVAARHAAPRTRPRTDDAGSAPTDTGWTP